MSRAVYDVSHCRLSTGPVQVPIKKCLVSRTGAEEDWGRGPGLSSKEKTQGSGLNMKIKASNEMIY